MKLSEVTGLIFEQPHRTMRLTVAMVALMIMSFMLIADHNQVSAQSNTTWTATLSAEQDTGDEYGYEEGVMGSITDDTFDLDGRSYTIDYIKWDESQDEIEFRMLECLKESEFVSLRIGSRTYSSVDRVNHSDADCEERRTRNQEFEFDASSNPLRDGRNYTITLTLRGSGSGGGVTPPGSADWSTYINSGEDNDEYGYEYNDFGTIGDRTFEHGGRTYTIDYIKWDDDDDEIEFGIEECLKPSDFTSITIGSRTYSDPDQVSDSDSRCQSYPDSFQEFEFHNITTNPMPENSRIAIGLNLSGDSTTTPTVTTTPTATASLSPDPSTMTFRADGAWHRFTVTSSESVKVVANPGTTPRRVEIHDQSITADYCPADPNDSRTIRNGGSVYLAGCVAGTATVELRRSDDTVLRTYRFTISSASSTPPAPAAPTGLRRTSSGATSIGVSWNSVSGAAKYAVEYREDGASTWTTAADNLTGTTYAITGLRCGRTHYVQVRSFGDGTNSLAQWSGPSSTLLTTTAACPAAAASLSPDP